MKLTLMEVSMLSFSLFLNYELVWMNDKTIIEFSFRII